MFIKRHKLTKDDGVSFFTPADFAVGEQVTIYGRTFFLVDADTFTREFYKTQMGMDLPGPMGYPDDPVDTYRATFGLTRGANGKGEHILLWLGNTSWLVVGAGAWPALCLAYAVLRQVAKVPCASRGRHSSGYGHLGVKALLALMH